MFVELAPTAIDKLSAGQTVELALLDCVIDAHGFALGWHEVEPAARGKLFRVEFQNAVGERVALPEIVEEPAVESGTFERALDSGSFERPLNLVYARGAPVVRVRVVCRCHVVHAFPVRNFCTSRPAC